MRLCGLSGASGSLQVENRLVDDALSLSLPDQHHRRKTHEQLICAQPALAAESDGLYRLIGKQVPVAIGSVFLRRLNHRIPPHLMAKWRPGYVAHQPGEQARCDADELPLPPASNKGGQMFGLFPLTGKRLVIAVTKQFGVFAAQSEQFPDEVELGATVIDVFKH